MAHDDSRENATPAKDDAVSFALLSHLKGLCFGSSTAKPPTFRSETPEVTISIALPDSAPASFAELDKLECKSTCSMPTSPDVATFVAGLIAQKYIPIDGSPIALPVRVKGEERIDAHGNILAQVSIPFELYPPSVQALWTDAMATLLHAQERFLRLLRWTQDLDGPHDLYRSRPTLYWKSGSCPKYHCTRHPADAPHIDYDAGGHGIGWNDEHVKVIREIWEAGDVVEPLGHELLREARFLRGTGSHRSALLMAATAMETGVKDHIGRQRPHALWLLQNLPSPPVHKILRHYLPDMHSSTSIVGDWAVLKPLWTACQKLVEARNTTAHTGSTLDPSSVDAHIRTAADVLYILDALAGHTWARQRVTTELRKSLGWPNPQEHRIVVARMPDRWEIDTA